VSETANGSVNLGSGTASGLLAFLDWVVGKKLATPAAITPLKSASKQVFETVEDDGTDLDSVDVRSLDVDDYFRRFEVAMQATGRLTPDSVRAYRNRFTRSLDMYSEYLSTGQAPRIPVRQASAGTAPRSPRNRQAVSKVSPPAPGVIETTAEPDASGTLISYPFPLESGEVANLRLPKRLGKRDAQRLNNFITALVFEFEPMKEIEAGPAS